MTAHVQIVDKVFTIWLQINAFGKGMYSFFLSLVYKVLLVFYISFEIIFQTIKSLIPFALDTIDKIWYAG